jgi:endonuclease YncB( thermonuclease family)
MLAALGAALLVAGSPTVVRVVDGDTLQVRANAAVRTVHLAGVDAPDREACGGGAARRALARLLPRGARVRLRRDAAAPGARYVYRRGRLVNAALLRDGAAKPGDTGGLRKRAALLAAARGAEQQRRGVWAECPPPPASAPDPAAGGQDPIARARAELADRMFVSKTGTSLWDRSERRLHLCQDGFAGDYWSWVFHSNTGSGRTEGSWEVVSAASTTARVRLFNSEGETFRTFSVEGGRVSIDGIAMTEVAASDVCAVRRSALGAR